MIWKISGNRRLQQMLEGISIQIRMYLAAAWDQVRNPSQYASGHRDILDAVRAKSKKAGVTSIEEHLEGAAARAIATFRAGIKETTTSK
jgi:DNA-binding GntR family transcriptional regulator